MKTELNKLLNNEDLNSSELYKLTQLGLIQKITYNQHVITKKGLLMLNN